MKSIEFVGPSAIGKTTFCKALNRHPEKPSGWTDARRALAETGFGRKPGILQRVIRKAGFTQNPYPSRAELFRLYSDDLDPVLRLFESGLVKTAPPAWQKIHVTRYFHQSMLYRMLLLHHLYGEKRCVYFEEGIVHVGGAAAMAGEAEDFKEITRSSVFPAAVVFLDAPDDVYRERILSRFKQTGRRDLNPVVTDISDDDLDEVIRSEKEETARRKQFCKTIGVPVLTLPSECTDDTVRRLAEFLTPLGE
jgi:hypothetical protein